MICGVVLINAATPPGLINYQGVLRDDTGAPLDGSYDMVFTFFNDATAGEEILIDSHLAAGSGAVTVSDGLFNVALGSGTVTDGSGAGTYIYLAAMFRDYAAVWLQVTVGGEDLSPRVRVLASAYAQNADHLDGLDSSAFLTSESDPSVGPLTAGKWCSSSDGSTVECTSDLPSSDDGDWTISGSNMYSSVSGNVGIGISSPGNDLTVYSTEDNDGLALRVSDNTYSQGLMFRNSGGAYTWKMYRKNIGSNDADLVIAKGPSTDITALTDVVTFQEGGLQVVGGEVVDQENDSHNQYNMVTPQWQSFTAGLTGNLTKIMIYAVTTGTRTLSIYEGTGTGGTLLGTTTVSIGYDENEIVLSSPIPVTAGQIYTCGLSTPGIGLSFSTVDVYPGGSAALGGDWVFRTYVTTDTSLIVSDGHVGINTSTPQTSLDVAGSMTVSGQIKITGGNPGAGKVLTSDADGLASWQTPARSQDDNNSDDRQDGADYAQFRKIARSDNVDSSRLDDREMRSDRESPSHARTPGIQIPIAQGVRSGDVLVINTAIGAELYPCSQEADPLVVGIAVDDGEGFFLTAVTGIAYVNVDATLSPIREGDLLVSSPITGHAMKMKTLVPGTVIGKALEPLDSGTGMIKVLVMVR